MKENIKMIAEMKDEKVREKIKKLNNENAKKLEEYLLHIKNKK